MARVQCLPGFLSGEQHRKKTLSDDLHVAVSMNQGRGVIFWWRP